MKKGLILAVFLMLAMSAIVYAQFPEISITTDASNDRAMIKWQTSNLATSSIDINNKILVFGPDRSFSHEESGLQSGKEYRFKIIACAEGYCSTHKSSIQTEGDIAASAITGGIVAGIADAGAQVYYFLAALLGLTLILVSYRVSQPDARIARMLNDSESRIREGQHEKAAPIYKKALSIYRTLNDSDKVRHYHRLARIYNHLSTNQKQKEAKILTEKYQKGAITQLEMERLRQLLTE